MRSPKPTHLADYENLEVAIAADLADASVPRLLRTDTVSTAAERFVTTHLHRLPVFHEETGELVGTLARGDIPRRGNSERFSHAAAVHFGEGGGTALRPACTVV